MEKARQVCAILDMQGFQIGKKFFPREIAIVNDYYKLCFEIDSGISQELKVKSFRHFSFQQHNVHGIPVEKVIEEKTKRVFKLVQLNEIILQIYLAVRTVEKSYIAVK